MEKASVSVRKPTIEVIGFLSRRRLHLERSPSGTRHCSQPENADFLSEMFPDRHLDFKEIATAHAGTGRDQFELFARDFLEAEGFEIVRGPDQGPDAGRDLIVRER